MRRGAMRISLSLCALTIFVVAACSPLDSKHGYVPRDEELEQVIVGVDTKDTVADAIGKPSASGVLSTGGWYYVESTFQKRGVLAPQEVDREVVAISFDEAGTVRNIERFGLEDGNVIAISRRVTDSNIKGISFLRQLFGNLGRLDAGQLLGEN